MRTFGKILKYLALTILLSVFAVAVMIQLPVVQTRLTEFAASKVQEFFDADVHVGHLSFKPFNTLVIRDLSVVDKSPRFTEVSDTLLYISHIDAKFSLMSIIGPGHEGFILQRVKVEDGWFNLVVEGDKMLPTNLHRMFSLRRDRETRDPKQKDIFTIRHIQVRGIRYTQRNPLREASNDGTLDFNDIDVRNLCASAENFRMSHGRFYAHLENASLQEKSGLAINALSADLVAGQGDTRVFNIHIEDNCGSEADLDFTMLGRRKDLYDFKNRVLLEVLMHDCRLAQKTLASISPAIRKNGNATILIDGRIKGKVVDLNICNLGIGLEKTSLSARINGNIRNITSPSSMMMNIAVKDARFKTSDIASAMKRIMAKDMSNIQKISQYGGGKTYRLQASARGGLNKLSCSLNLYQTHTPGNAIVKVIVSNLRNASPLQASGTVSCTNLDLGLLSAQKILGPATLSADISACMGSGETMPDATVRNIKIDRMVVNGYAYHGISGDAVLDKGRLSADLISSDPNCNMDLSAWSDESMYNLALNIRRLDLNAINIDPRQHSELSMKLLSGISRDFKNPNGEASITDICLTSADGPQYLSDIRINAGRNEGIYDISATSEDFNCSFTGNKKQLKADFVTINTTAFLAYMLPGAYIDSGSRLFVEMDPDGNIGGNIISHRVAWKENYIKDLQCSISGNLNDIDAHLTAGEIMGAGFSLENNLINICYKEGHAAIGYSFLNGEGKSARGGLSLEADIRSIKDFDLNIKPTKWVLNGNEWTIAQSSVRKNTAGISVEGFRLGCGKQSISASGLLSSTDKGSMNARIRNIDLAAFNGIIDNFNLDLEGDINADAIVESPIVSGNPCIRVNIDAKNLKAAGTDLGRLIAACDYDRNLDHYYLSANQKIAGRNALQANAILMPKGKGIDATVIADRYPFGFAQRFIPSVISELDGYLSGSFHISGPKGAIGISSRGARLDDGMTQVALTHVRYSFAGDISCSNSGISFDNVVAKDRFGTPAPLNGGVSWGKKTKPELDARFEFQGIELVNIPADIPGQRFWGQVFTDGSISFTGPFNSLTMGMNIRSTGDSQMRVRVSKTANASHSNLLTFVDMFDRSTDPYEQMLSDLREKRRRRSNFNIRMHAIVNPNLKLVVDLGDNLFSSGVKGTGSGVLDVDYDKSSKNYNIFGDYILSEGKVDVNASNLVRRVFTIQDGSSIRFNGKIPDSNINLTALYQTKTTISALIADTEDDGKRRNVECGINVSNNIKNPDIRFNINIPDLNPSIKSSVDAALSTDDKVQKQFLSLLLSNSFLPDEQGGIVNNSSMLFSNVTEIMANQVNNIFSKLEIPLDLGLKYQPTDNGANLFDVAVSTQLFNNRVIIGGNFGNRQNAASGDGTFFGDVDVQYKVLRSGSLRLKAFSHSADKYSNFLDNGQRNGLGISWQQEFDSLPQWFKMLFSSKAKREALIQMETLNIKKQTTIILDE